MRKNSKSFEALKALEGIKKKLQALLK